MIVCRICGQGHEDIEAHVHKNLAYIDYSRYATESDLKNVTLRSGKASRIFTSRGYYKIGPICAIRNF